jgi:hypothetical protein
MSVDVAHDGTLSLRRLQTVLRNDEQGYGALEGLKVSGQETVATHGDEFPAVRSLVLRKFTLAAPPPKDNEALLFKGKALLLGVESDVAAYRVES